MTCWRKIWRQMTCRLLIFISVSTTLERFAAMRLLEISSYERSDKKSSQFAAMSKQYDDERGGNSCGGILVANVQTDC